MPKTLKTSIGDIQIRDYFDEKVAEEVIEQHLYEHWGEIKLSGNVIDLGAHIGTFSALALFNGCSVTAVEPSPSSFSLLKINAPNATLINKAVSNQKQVFLAEYERSELNMVSDHGILVDCVTLDELIDKPVDVLKIDIEGSEYDVLYSCSKLDMIAQITMEYHHGLKKLGKLLVFLENKGFKFGWIGGQDFGHLQVKK